MTGLDATGRGAKAQSATPGSTGGLELVAARRLLLPAVTARIRLAPGDRVLVREGEEVTAGTRLASRLRDPGLRDAGKVGRMGRGHVAEPGRPGGRWSVASDGSSGESGEGSRGRRGGPHGEYLFEVGGRWQVVAGELADAVEAPAGGRVTEVRPGISLALETAAMGLCAADVLGGPSRGQLVIAAAAGGEVRASSIDVGRAGTILVAGARIDAEALTRARAMGVRGVIVAGMPSKERRDFMASEARQRASRQSLPPFAVLVLDGVMRRPVPSPVMAILEALEGRHVGIVDDPATLVIDDAIEPAALPVPTPDLVRVRAGVCAGREGRWLGLAGRRRFPGGVDLDAASMLLDGGDVVTVPIGDLERFT